MVPARICLMHSWRACAPHTNMGSHTFPNKKYSIGRDSNNFIAVDCKGMLPIPEG